VNFTREPIIETIITPKEGYKLLVRSSKGMTQEEHSVDALEVISFGPAIFYRSQERPKPFLVPVGDFEVIEIKETRVVLKNANLERAIKIGGGREPPARTPRESPPEKREQPVPIEAERPSQEESSLEHRLDKRKDRRRRRRRGGPEGRSEQREPRSIDSRTEKTEPSTEGVVEGGGAHDETQVSSPTFSPRFSPPSTLISQTLSRYKDQALAEDPVSLEERKKKRNPEEESPGTESSSLSRTLSTQEPFDDPYFKS
jgi:hypothetical protein